MSKEECLAELSALTDELLEVALLVKLLLPCFPKDGVPGKSLRRLSDYLSQHTEELQVLTRCLSAHVSRGSR